MKRSKTILLVLSGGIVGSALTGCSPSESTEGANYEIAEGNTYTNNHYVHGAGYYHAPYRGWFPYPYNHYVPGQGYFAGNQWKSTPEQSGVVASNPSEAAVQEARSRSGVSTFRGVKSGSGSSISTTRGGFGGFSRGSGSS